MIIVIQSGILSYKGITYVIRLGRLLEINAPYVDIRQS